MNTRALVGAVGLLLLLGVAGCGGGRPSTPPSVSSAATAPALPGLPPRPAVVPVDGVDPCGLLTEAQRSQFGVGAGQPSSTDYGGPNKGPSCAWLSLTPPPDYGYSARAVLNRGVDAVHSQEPPRVVDGFAAVTTGTIGTDPAIYCQIFLDLAPGKALTVTYDNDGHDIPGMNHQLACDKAQQAAALMLANLRAGVH